MIDGPKRAYDGEGRGWGEPWTSSGTKTKPRRRDEDRYLTFGLSAADRVLIVSHTDRGLATRIISARVASQSERRGYEDGNYPRAG